MRKLLSAMAATLIGAGLVGGVALAGSPAARNPATAGPLSPESVYQGVWYEQARTPTSLTRGCEYASTVYGRDVEGRITVRDACLQDGPRGRERALEGIGTIRDPGQNAVLSVRYRFGVFRPSREYRIIAAGPAGEWFISAEPGFQRVYIFTRAVAPPRAEVEGLIARVRMIGYGGPIEILATQAP